MLGLSCSMWVPVPWPGIEPGPPQLGVQFLSLWTAGEVPEDNCSKCCYVVVIVQSLSHIQLFATPWTAARRAPLSFTISRSLLKLISIELMMPSNHLILCHPLLLLPSNLSQHRGLFPWVGSSGGQNIEASVSVLPMNIQDWFPLGWTGFISLQSKGLSRVFSNTTVQKHQFFGTQLSLLVVYKLLQLLILRNFQPLFKSN